MPRLIVVNGPPAVGKSTLARRYAEEHPGTLNLDIDGVRRLIGGWRDDPLAAGLRARELCLLMASDHLTTGADVVVPQYLGKPEFLRQLEEVAHDAGAGFAEFALTDDRDTLVARFHRRTAGADVDPVHRDAAELVARLGGDDALFAMYDRLLLVLNARPGAVVLHCPDGAQDEVYARLLTALNRPA